ncbi:MAG: hypothetical protein SFY68_09905 [Candidatus Sumerlaeia bacterium]|nr:hypothetical protein [Candidatus Sumerlaeia bacterium]
MSKPIHRCLTKATAAEGDQLQYGPNWMLSRRGILKVFPDRLCCGDWEVPFDSITEAVLYSVRGPFFLPGYVLKITTPERTIHFGLNSGKFWKSDLPFAVKREAAQLRYSTFSRIVRLVVVVFIFYHVWSWLSTPPQS